MHRDLSEEQLAARQRLLLEVNSNIGADAHDLPANEREAKGWDFLCECGDADCTEVVHLTLARYDQLRFAQGFVLAETHALQRAEAARAGARELKEGAAALRAQPSTSGSGRARTAAGSARSSGGRAGSRAGRRLRAGTMARGGRAHSRGSSSAPGSTLPRRESHREALPRRPRG